jgi:hypothetical protein
MILKTIAKILARPRIATWIIKHGQRTPYFHLDGYMDRWWLMPRFLLTRDARGNLFPRKWLPFSIRLHHIKREDDGRVMHDHPANFRTFILSGWYIEQRVTNINCNHVGKSLLVISDLDYAGCTECLSNHFREHGDTATLRSEQYHRISYVSYGGVWTIFIMGRRRQEWGFWVRDENNFNGRKIPWREYEDLNK